MCVTAGPSCRKPPCLAPAGAPSPQPPDAAAPPPPHAPPPDEAGPVFRLPWATLAVDPAFLTFVFIHAAAFATPFAFPRPSLRDAALVLCSYVARMFGITAGFHRLLSHRSFSTNRVVQFVLAWLGTASLQKGPLWWCSHHRQHHRTADTPSDAHSPSAHGFWWAHCGWFLLTNRHVAPVPGAVPDLAALPELRFLEKFYLLPPAALAAGLGAFGGARAVGYGFFVATVLCWHATYCINSVAHLVGTRRFACQFQAACTARNNFLLAVLTLGEGWHNNHHRFMASVQHGLVQPRELDVTYYVIRLMESVGLAWNLKLPPAEWAREAGGGAVAVQ